MSSHLVIIVPSTLLLILSAPVSPGWLKNSDQRSVNCLFISGILRRNDFLHPPRIMELDPKYADVICKRWAEFKYGEGGDWKALTPEIENVTMEDKKYE